MPTENLRRLEEERIRQHEQESAEITALCSDLERLVENPVPDLARLERQADLLDCLLYTILRRNLRKDKKYREISDQRLELALRIQKQCAETMKTHAAIKYMHALAPVIELPPLPILPDPLPPPEQTN